MAKWVSKEQSKLEDLTYELQNHDNENSKIVKSSISFCIFEHFPL